MRVGYVVGFEEVVVGYDEDVMGDVELECGCADVLACVVFEVEVQDVLLEDEEIAATETLDVIEDSMEVVLYTGGCEA